MLNAALLLLLACSAPVLPRHLPPYTEECSQCQEDTCPRAQLQCPGGKLKDHCGCCWRCANVEGQMCDLPHSKPEHGVCGDGLQCQLRGGHMKEEQCVCLSQGSVCGTDRRTYRNNCRLREAAITRWRTNLRVKHTGPCREAPVLFSAPQDTPVLQGQSILLGCEVSAQPLAELEWRKDGIEGPLPGRSSHIIVQTHGGPQRHLVTGWLQIHWVRASDTGIYTCHAWNHLGHVSASATLTVIPSESPWASEVLGYQVEIFDVTDDEDVYGRSHDGASGSYE